MLMGFWERMIRLIALEYDEIDREEAIRELGPPSVMQYTKPSGMIIRVISGDVGGMCQLDAQVHVSWLLSGATQEAEIEV